MTPACRRRIQVCFLAGTVIWPCALLAQQPGQPGAVPQAAPKQAPAKAAAPKTKADKPKPDATAAQNEVEAGIAAMGQGKNDAAVGNLSTALSAGSLPPGQTSRALYYRGVAYRRQGKPAQAISDLTNALWIKNGLSEEQRADALQQRSGAYREAGLPEQGDPAPARTVAAPKASATAAKTPPAPTQFAAVAPPAPSAPASAAGSVGSFFGSIFGGSTPPETPAPAAVAAATSSAPQRQGRQPLPTGFQGFPDESATFYQGPSRSSQASPPQSEPPTTGTVVAKQGTAPTEVKPAAPVAQASQGARPKAEATPKVAPQKAASSPQPPATTATAPAKAKATTVAGARGTAAGGPAPAGNFQVLVAAVRTAQEAQGVASKLQAGFAREMGGRAPVVDQTVAGSLGTIYRVQVGPFASARDTEALCAKLKGEGMECRVVTQ